MRTIEEIKADLEMLESFGINSVEMHDRLIGYLEELLNYRQAERDGRLAVLPHPIGCKVYHIETDGVLKGMIREVTVAGYSENKWQGRANSEKDHRFVIFHNSYNQPIACQLCNVYRTREEAERTLKGA